MSALGQKRTFRISFDHLVGKRKQRGRHGADKRFGRRCIAVNFSPKLLRRSICRVPFTASFGLTQLQMIRKYGGAYGQGDVEIGAHSKNC